MHSISRNHERSGFMRVHELGPTTISGTYILCSSNKSADVGAAHSLQVREIGDAKSWKKIPHRWR